jgi:hypothetical protein
MYVPVQGLGHACSIPRRVTLLDDVATQVEGDAELTCSWVANVEGLLHDALASVTRNILSVGIWVAALHHTEMVE